MRASPQEVSSSVSAGCVYTLQQSMRPSSGVGFTCFEVFVVDVLIPRCAMWGGGSCEWIVFQISPSAHVLLECRKMQ